MTDTIEGNPTAGSEPGVFARFAGVIFSPAKTFESIARKPAWVPALVVVLLWTAIAGFFISQRIDVDAIVAKQVASAEKQGKTMPEDQLEGMKKVTAIFVKMSFLIGALWYAAVLFVVPLVYHGLSSALGRGGRYTAVLSAYTHVQIVQIVKGALLLVVALPRAAIDPDTIPRLLKSNIGAFLDAETTNPTLLAVATAIDVFDLFALALMVIALQKVTGLKRGSALAVVGGAWALWVAISAVLATIGAMFRG